MILFAICLGLYIYVMVDSDSVSMHIDGSNQFLKEKASSCYEDFRKHNCTVSQHMSDVCEQLYACVRKVASDERGHVNISTHKIDRIEESLENILLWIGGLGVGSMIGKMALKSRRLMRRLIKLATKAGDFLKTLKEKDRPEQIIEEGQATVEKRRLVEVHEENDDDSDNLLFE